MSSKNPFASQCLKEFSIGSNNFKYYSLSALEDPRVAKLPYSVRVLLESAIRNCDEFEVKTGDVENILNWATTSEQDVEIPFKPARVLLQDFTGVPAVVDLAAMRDAMVRLGGDPQKINPLCPVDLVIDHSIQVDVARSPEALARNEAREYERNSDRFAFLKWGSTAFENFQIVPPGSGIVHQVNLEYLARGVFNTNGVLFPDSCVGTDSHTTMINGLGIVGWGVGGIEAESVMLGQAISMVLPQVVGFRLTGELPQHATATDLVLTATNMLRKRGVVGKFVEFFGPGLDSLSLADRATVSNMGPEYGATIGYFPMDDVTVDFLRNTGRPESQVAYIDRYIRENSMFRSDQDDPKYSGDIMELDLASVEPCMSGPKRPHDKVTVSAMPKDFRDSLTAPVGFKGFDLPNPAETKTFEQNGEKITLENGSVVIAAITSCTNTSNPAVMMGAGLLARNAVQKGLRVNSYIKTSLSPGSGVVTEYLENSGLNKFLDDLGFHTAGYGCMTCIGNSGELEKDITEAIQDSDLVVGAVLSGNRNFEGRVHPLTRANYLASPPLVVAYALAGRLDIDFATEPIGEGDDGPVFLQDIWPSREEVQGQIDQHVTSEMFTEVYKRISKGTDRWNSLEFEEGDLYAWDEANTYIHNPSFFKNTELKPAAIPDIENAYCLLNVGDSITTDHISPAGVIARDSPAARYLESKGVKRQDYNTYGARRGNDEVMARGTFANVRLINKLADKAGPMTKHIPSGEQLAVFDAAERYMDADQPSIILAGKEYGSGSSRDWAAKGPYLQGVKAVVAESFERIHRSNLVGMGILPCVFLEGENADTLGLTGEEQFSIKLNGGDISTFQIIDIEVSNGKKFQVKARLDTDVEVEYFKNGGILNYVLRRLIDSDSQ